MTELTQEIVHGLREAMLKDKEQRSWTVLDTEGMYGGWLLCQCSCGVTARIRRTDYTTGRSTKCRKCAYVEISTHKKSASSIYRRWVNMKNRCYCPKDKKYKHYGGRGIKVCREWLDFDGFYRDMGDPPPGMTLDRIDVDGNYCKDNCRWTSYTEQNCNQQVRINNISGTTGVFWSKRHKKWGANIRIDGVKLQLGVYDSLEEAVAVRIYAEAVRRHKYAREGGG